MGSQPRKGTMSILYVLCSCLAFVSLGAADVPVTFRDLAQGDCLQFPPEARAELLVLRDQPSLDAVWGVIHAGQSPLPPAPQIAFPGRFAIAVLDQARSSGGYAVRVATVTMTAEGIGSIDIVTSYPGPDMGVTAVMTRPYHLVEVVPSR